MKHFFNMATFLLWTIQSFGQSVQRQGNETAEQFVLRLKPDSSSLTYKIVESKWNALPVIIAFYDQTYKLTKQNDPSKQPYRSIIGVVFIRLDSNLYFKTFFGSIDTEGGGPTIETVFLANADNDADPELIVIASWEQRHYEVDGKLYGTFVFDNNLWNTSLDWKLLKVISEKLDGGCECNWRDGKV